MRRAGNKMMPYVLENYACDAGPVSGRFDAGRIGKLVAERTAMLVTLMRWLVLRIRSHCVSMWRGTLHEVEAIRSHLVGRDARDHREHHGSE